jgi:hypothetical protein
MDYESAFRYVKCCAIALEQHLTRVSPVDDTQDYEVPMDRLVRRMIGAAELQLPIYQEVEADKNATGQAALVIVLVAVASGIGLIGVNGRIGILWGALSGLVGWALFAGLVYYIGAKILPVPKTEADWGRVARTLAFANSPGVLRIFAINGFTSATLSSLLMFLIRIWVIVASVVAVRESMD